MRRQIRRGGVAGVAAQNFSQERPGHRFLPQAQPRLRLEEEGRGFLPERQIVLEQEQGGEGGGEVVNFGRRLLQGAGMGEQVKQKFFRRRLPPQFFQGERRVKGHFAEGADAHLLKIAAEIGGGEPVAPRLFFFTERIQGQAGPIMGVALVGQQVPGFAQVLRREKRVLEMGSSAGKIMARQGLASEGKPGADVLLEGRAFAAFPGLKLAPGEELHGFGVAAGLIEQGAEFHGQVVALADEGGIFFQLAQTPGRFFAEPFPKLVALVEEAGVARIGPAGAVEGGAGPGRLFGRC